MTPDTVVPIVWDILKCVADPIKDQLRYVVSSRSYTRDLQEQVEILQFLFDHIQNATDMARMNLGIVYEYVTEWQAGAGEALMAARHLLSKFGEEAKTCCSGTLPDPNYLYKFSREAEDKKEDIMQLLRKGRNIQSVHFMNPITRIKRRDEDGFKSRASILLHIMDALADDSKSVVGVYGMAGVGKSFLLSKTESIIDEQKSFRWIAKANLLGKQDITGQPVIEGIQDEIASSLQLDMTNASHERRKKLLEGRLDQEEKMKNKVLIILDNLSKKVQLELVGIPCGHDNKVRGCKLLLASRDLNVLTRDMHCDSVFRLPELDVEEAKKLFERTAGDKAYQGEFKTFVDKALPKCAGLPQLIVEMANIFRAGTLAQQNEALSQIEMLKDEGIGKIINDMMQSSYDHLSEEKKSFLRLCVVYGVPMPNRENLVRYGIGYLLDLKYKSMKSARHTLTAFIETLEASSLSLDNGDADSFKIHELVYKFVALVASRDDRLLVLKDRDMLLTQELTNNIRSCKAICFPDVNEQLPEELDCPELLILLLFTRNKSLQVSDSYFNSMKDLKVLNLTGIRLTFSPSPSPFRLLEKLHTLCLDDCSLENVSILGELKGLQILSLVNSTIQRLPREIGQLEELRLLDLNNCSQLEIIDPDVLGSLTKLEELYMENSFDNWDAGTNASLTELNNMTKLYTLHISIPDPSVLPMNLNIQNLLEYKIRIGKVPHLPGYEVSKTLMIEWIQGSDILWNQCIQSTLRSTENLYLDGLNKVVKSICLLLPEEDHLKHLHVVNSSSIQYILIGSYNASFKMLESLFLQNLINLEKICRCSTFSQSFNSLKEVRVESCNKMEVLFPFPLARELLQLQEIRVVNCKSLQKIVEVDDSGKVEFKNLHVLELRDLPDIKNFFTAGTAPSSGTSDSHVGTQVTFFYGQQVSIPFLKSLTMAGLPNLKDIWSDESLLGVSNLQFLTVEECKSLSTVIEFRSLAKLHKLQTLTVAHCSLVEEIFDLNVTESSASENVEIFSKLTMLCLEELPSLRHIWNKNPCGIVRFCYLKKLEVFGCNNLRFMFFPSMVKFLVQLRELTVRNCKIMEAIIMEEEGSRMETSETLTFPILTSLCFENLEGLTCFSHKKCLQEAQSQDHVKLRSTALFNGEVAFPRLETLEITSMDKVKMIWDSQVTANSFPTLKSLCVDRCCELVNIGPSCILQWLRNLEKLEAKACRSLEVLFKLQPLKGNDVACFKLKQLQLIELPELKCVWDEELFQQVNFQYPPSVSISKCKRLTSLFPALIVRDPMQPEESENDECGIVEIIKNTSGASHKLALKTSEVHGCDKAEILALQPENEMLHHEQPPVSKKKGVEAKEGPSRELSISDILKYFNRLETLNVSHCDGLTKMFTPAIAESLKRLTVLRISNCKMLTEVISDEGGNAGGRVIFSHLKHLELDGLTELRCFSLGRYTLDFPLLKDIIVIGCLNMKFLSGGPIKAPMVERVQVSREALYLNIAIQNMFKEMGMFARVKFLLLSELPELSRKWHNQSIESSWQLESLVVDKCPSFLNAIPSTMMLVLENMRKLQVRDCKLLEEILDLEGLETMGSTLLLPGLQHFDLVNLPELKRLWNKDLQGTMHFNSLNSLTLYNCSNLRHAFTPSMARCLATLTWMAIKKCDQMEGVIAEEEGHGSATENITFLKLSSMKLERLPNLTSFLSGKNHTLDCPTIEHLFIAHCPRMRSLTWQSLMEIDHCTPSLFTSQVQFRRLESIVISNMDQLSKIWSHSSQETFTFKHLRKVEVQNCMSLEIVFPCRVATSLIQLEKLRVESCGLKEIVTRGDDTPHSSTAQLLFPELTSLVLHDMPRLKNFCPDLPTLNCPFLKELRVTHCDKLKRLSFAASMNNWAQRDDHQVISDQEAQSSLGREFPKLERLLLVERNIQMIQDGKFPDDIFAKPKALTLACFHEEQAVFPSRFLLERFWNLQSLEVFCSSFEDIFLDEGPVDEGKYPVLENLRELKLSKLPKLRRVCREDYLVSKVLQSIRMFEVSDCPGLTKLFPTTTSFQNLTKLVVKNSSGLIYLVTFSAVTNLVHLMDLTIKECEKMEAVVGNDGNGEGKVISLGKLKSLRLQNLPSLVCFSSTSHILQLPSLIDVEVEECPKMEIFSRGLLSTPNLHSATLFGYFWEAYLEGDLNSALQKLSA